MNQMKLKLVPSEDGSSVFVRGGRRLSRIPLAEGTDALGIMLVNYELASLARLVHRGYVSRMEVESADLLSHRSEIQELSHTIGSAALERAFARDIAREANRIAAPLRDSPSRETDRSRQESRASGSPVATMRAMLAAIKDHRRTAVEGTATLLKAVDPELLRRVDVLVRRDASGSALQRFRRLVVRYAGRWEIPEYLALVILELVNNLQVQTMRNVARRSGMSDEKLRTLYQSTEIRDQITSMMERQGEASAIGWGFSTKQGAGARTTELTVTLSGAGAPMRAFSSEVAHQREIEIGERSLEEFYNEIGDSIFNIDLGLYYLSYLDDLCHKTGMRFSTQVREVGYENRMVVTLRIEL
ncbi:MAG: hypothetical protein ACOCYX_04710 [Spirochaetota bacterium]